MIIGGHVEESTNVARGPGGGGTLFAPFVSSARVVRADSIGPVDSSTSVADMEADMTTNIAIWCSIRLLAQAGGEERSLETSWWPGLLLVALIVCFWGILRYRSKVQRRTRGASSEKPGDE